MPTEHLHALLFSAAPADAPFLRVPGGRRWTYGEVGDLAGRIGSVLVDAGVAPGDRVMVQTEKSAEAVALYLATIRIGAVYVPLNTAYTTDEVGFFEGDAEPTVFVGDPGSAHRPTATSFTLGADGAGTVCAAAATASVVEPVERSGDDPAAMLYTSGTTGRSKGAVLTDRNLTSNALALHEAWAFEPGDVLLHMLPIFHVHGLFVALHCAMLNGSEVVFLPRFDVDVVIGELPSATVLMGVPTQYVRLLGDRRFDAELSRGMRLFTSGSAPMTEQVHRAFTERTGHRILERYGMTEAGMITSNPYHGDRIPATVGFPLPGVEIRVVDDAGSPVDKDVAGIVQVRGPNVFSGYWKLPDKTAHEFRDGGWFHTGDVGSVDGDGRLTLAGRASDMIISGGLNVYPKEIEAVLDGVPGVVESAVVGVPHLEFGEAVVAFVVCEADVDTEELERCMGGLARFKHPKRIIRLDSLPRNTMGKVQKAELRRTHADLFS
jgi:malonyl-CoA/methylmalonyl-CoA synthetase